MVYAPLSQVCKILQILDNPTINFLDGEVTNLKWFDIDNLPENIFHLNKPVLDNLKQYLETKKVIVD